MTLFYSHYILLILFYIFFRAFLAVVLFSGYLFPRCVTEGNLSPEGLGSIIILTIEFIRKWEKSPFCSKSNITIKNYF